MYQPADEAMRVGGNWYLVVPLDRSRRIAVSVGDTVGHGLSAAIVTSKLRAALWSMPKQPRSATAAPGIRTRCSSRRTAPAFSTTADVRRGFARLLKAAGRCADLPVGNICAGLPDRMAPPDGYIDDVAILALRPGHTGSHSFATVLPADLAELSAARQRLRNWLAAIGVSHRRESNVLLATGEAITNAIEHGSGCDARRTVAVEAFLRGSIVAATVSDSGRWSADSPASLRSSRRGRGLTLINGLADHVDTVRTARGTRVTSQFDHAVTSDQGG